MLKPTKAGNITENDYRTLLPCAPYQNISIQYLHDQLTLRQNLAYCSLA